jgi:hypothetical protein
MTVPFTKENWGTNDNVEEDDVKENACATGRLVVPVSFYLFTGA